MHVGAGPDAHRPVGTIGNPYMYVGSDPDPNDQPKGQSWPVGTPTISWELVRNPTGPRGAGGDKYMHVKAGRDANRPRGVKEIHTHTLKPVQTSTGPWEPVGTRTCTWEPVRTPVGNGKCT